MECGSFPALDDHLVEAEVTRDEIIGGQRVVLSPSPEPYATQHTDVNHVVRAHVAPGYGVATHLLTRPRSSAGSRMQVRL